MTTNQKTTLKSLLKDSLRLQTVYSTDFILSEDLNNFNAQTIDLLAECLYDVIQKLEELRIE